MPWCDIFSPTDQISIWYYTNAASGNVGGFDASKETILLIHPYFMDSSWMRLQFNDVNLHSCYNLIAYDTRNHGLTQSTPTGKQDVWVMAADIAFLHHRLGLPPLHVFACQPTATYAALHFAALFPEKVLSLCLCQVPPPRQLEWVHKASDNFLRHWYAASDQTELELVTAGILEAFTGADQSEEDLRAELFSHLLTQYPPCRRSRFAELSNTIMNRDDIDPRVVARVTAPTLIVQGQRNLVDPVKYAYELRDMLVNTCHQTKILEVEGGRGMLNLLPAFAKTVNQALLGFIQGLPQKSSPNTHNITLNQTTSRITYQKPAPATRKCLQQRMAQALQDLAEMKNVPKIAQRDPCSPLSFSCVTAELEQLQMQVICHYAADQSNAFDPLGPCGRLKRGWLERHIPSQIESYLNGVPVTEPHLFPVRLSKYGFNPMAKRKNKDRERTNSVMKLMEHSHWVKRDADHQSDESYDHQCAPSFNTSVRNGSLPVTIRTHPAKTSRPSTPNGSALVLFAPKLNPETMLPVSKDQLQLAQARRAGPFDPAVSI